MDAEPIRFDEVHGVDIRLSADGTEAELESLGDGVCFTKRPIRRGEDVLLKIPGLSSERGAGIRVGVCNKNPLSLSSSLLAGNDERTGLLAKELPAFEKGEQMAIYIEEGSGNLMMQNIDSNRSRVLFPGVAKDGDVYLVFELLEASRKVRISSRKRAAQVPYTGFHERLNRILSAVPMSVTPRIPTVEPAYFASSPLFIIQVEPTIAKSNERSPSRMNFAYVDTALKPGCTLMVKLVELKHARPVEIVLTTEDARLAYSYGFLPKLCEATYSVATNSAVPSAGDELAVRLSRSGVVYVSHNNGGWLERIHVDEKLEYHVIFSMEHVSVLSLVGIRTDVDEVVGTAVTSPQTPLSTRSVLDEDRESPSRIARPTECIICIENAREVVLLPCFHFALCESCARTLRRSLRAVCPACRATIVDVKRIYPV